MLQEAALATEKLRSATTLGKPGPDVTARSITIRPLPSLLQLGGDRACFSIEAMPPAAPLRRGGVYAGPSPESEIIIEAGRFGVRLLLRKRFQSW